MGYDITFHPISEAQMDAWYFSLLDSLAKGDTSRLEAVAEEAGMDPFYINKYRGSDEVCRRDAAFRTI